jgi:biopolymer transport protein ExbD
MAGAKTMKFTNNIDTEEPTFHLAPMIDVVFLLLIFFVTTSLLGELEAEVNLQLPSAETAQAPDRKPGEIIINVNTKGEIMVSGRIRTIEELETLLSREIKDRKGLSVIYRGDKGSQHGRLVEVMDVCRKLDIRGFKIPVLKKESPS